MSENTTFRPATPQRWVLWPVQTYLRLDLAWRNRLRLERRDLEVLRDLPRGAGIILTSNHADETDFKACLELSRRCNRRFLYMMNSRGRETGTGSARRLPGRGNLLPERSGSAQPGSVLGIRESSRRVLAAAWYDDTRGLVVGNIRRE